MVAGHPIISLPLPSALEPIYATFRGAGRMIWPAYYILVLAILWFASSSVPRRWLPLVLDGCLLVQVIDFRGGAALQRHSVDGAGLLKPLRDPIWNVIATRYTNLVSIPAFHGQPERHTLSWFAAMHGIGSNIGYFGRMNPHMQATGEKRSTDEVLRGSYAPNTVYYFPSPAHWLLARRTIATSDLAIVADGHHLIVPGGKTAEHPGVSRQWRERSPARTLDLVRGEPAWSRPPDVRVVVGRGVGHLVRFRRGDLAPPPATGRCCVS